MYLVCLHWRSKWKNRLHRNQPWLLGYSYAEKGMFSMTHSLRVISYDSYVMIHIIKCAQKSAEGQNSRLLELLRYIILYGQLYHIIWSIWYILYHMNMIHTIEIKLVPFKYWIRANSSWWWFDSRLRLFWWWQKPSHKLSTKTIL